ncbi:MAG: ATP-binding protein [Hyphomicrobiales bacterium]|nr:ATP-binding protein [Hyphomicrobiales bacterium]
MQARVMDSPLEAGGGERRNTHQLSERMIGRVIACDGVRATISAAATSLVGTQTDFWSIGKLISISMGNVRVVGLVCEMSACNGLWDEGLRNEIQVRIELVGEIIDHGDGKVEFRRGISNYPHLGAVAHRIRVADLLAIHDIGERAGIEVGWLSQDSTIPATVSVEDMLRCHFAVVGTTGVGKSSAVAMLLREAVAKKPNLRVLVLDPHNEYAHAFHANSISLDSTTLELPFWIFSLEEMTDVVFRGRPTVPEEIDALREIIAMAKGRYRAAGEVALSSTLIRKPLDVANFSADTPVPYRMSDVVKIIEEFLGQLEPRFSRFHVRSLRSRIESLNSDPRYRFMFGRTTAEDCLDRVISSIFRVPHQDRPITVLQLAGIPSEVVNAVVSVLARLAFDITTWSRGQFEVLLLCEEAHRYVPNDAALGFGPTRAAIARIAKEGRKYGCYVGIVTQRPGELDPTILSQCSTVFAMRLGNTRDQDIIRAAIADSSASTISFLSSIGNREAIAFGEGVATPMRITFKHQSQAELPAAAHGAKDFRNATESGITLREIIGRMRGGSETIDIR